MLTAMPVAAANAATAPSSTFRQQLDEMEASSTQADTTSHRGTTAAAKASKKTEPAQAKQQTFLPVSVTTVTEPDAKPALTGQLRTGANTSADEQTQPAQAKQQPFVMPGVATVTPPLAAPAAAGNEKPRTSQSELPATAAMPAQIPTAPTEEQARAIVNAALPTPTPTVTSPAAPAADSKATSQTQASDAKTQILNSAADEIAEAPSFSPAFGSEISFEGRLFPQDASHAANTAPDTTGSVAVTPVKPAAQPAKGHEDTTARQDAQGGGSESTPDRPVTTSATPFATATYQPDAPARTETTAAPAPAPHAPAEAAHVEAEAEHQPAAPVHDIRVQLESPTGERAEVRVTEASGTVQLTVRADASLSQALRDNLPDLKTQLERGDVQADLWHPGAERVSEAASASGGGGTGSSEAGNEQGAAGQQYQPEWLEQLAQARARQRQTRRGQ